MRRQSGFTLVELMIVIALIAAMAIFAIPNFLVMMPDFRLRSAAQDLLSNFQKAKMTAVKRNINTAVTFDGSGYTVFVDSSSPPNFELDGGEEEIITVKWSEYPGVSQKANNINEPVTGKRCIAFQSNGIPAVKAGAANGTVTLTNTNNKDTDIIISQSGNVRIE